MAVLKSPKGVQKKQIWGKIYKKKVLIDNKHEYRGDSKTLTNFNGRSKRYWTISLED